MKMPPFWEGPHPGASADPLPKVWARVKKERPLAHVPTLSQTWEASGKPVLRVASLSEPGEGLLPDEILLP